jgi:glyoxylase-like metal-dependent hydrolase (beta-lactamase superfamily II)
MNSKIIRLNLKYTNCYLIRLKVGYLLIDCGYDRDRLLFDKQLQKLQIKLNDVKFLFLTHHHDDHSGLTNYIVKQNPEVSVIMDELCGKLIKVGENDRTHGGGWCSKEVKFIAGLNRKLQPEWTLNFPAYTTRSKDILLSDENDTLLPNLGFNAKIIRTPGHTVDSISILDSEGNLFCGDAAANFLLWANSRYCPLFITDVKEYYRSWSKILSLGVKKIYPAHGKPFDPIKLRKYMNAITQDKLAEFIWE